MPNIDMFAITGGPCGGKSSALARLLAHFTALGYYVEIVPEAATDLIAEGIRPWEIGAKQFQHHVLEEILKREEAAKERCKAQPLPAIIFCDRGVMDGAAYVEPHEMLEIWKAFGYHPVALRDGRYDGVIHLRSTAVDLKHLFSSANNASRYEASAEDAAKVDERTLEAWIGCPHLAVIDNSTDFDGKLERVITWAETMVGYPEPHETERKFLVPLPFNTSVLPAHAQRIEIRQAYISDPSGTKQNARIRRRGQDGEYLYTITRKTHVAHGTVLEEESAISDKEYAYLHGTRMLPGYTEIFKDRWCFVANERYWELDIFDAVEGFALLEVELPRIDWHIELPDFFVGVEEVTGIRRYANAAIARLLAQKQRV